MGYRFVEHAGEVEVELEAPTEAGIFEAALAAFVDLVDGDASGEPTSHELGLEADDAALLLVDWLSELIFLAEVDRFVPDGAARIELDSLAWTFPAGSRIRVLVAGGSHPRFLRNRGTGELSSGATTFATARHTVHLGEATRLTLPVSGD